MLIEYNQWLMVNSKGIWRFADSLKPYVEEKFRLSLNEGNTGLQKVEGIYFKREDHNPTGSVKDRGLAYQISVLIKQGYSRFVISSSGNAAISAAAYCELVKAELVVFISPRINTDKLKKIEQYKSVMIKETLRPVSESIMFAKENNYYNLRPSKDVLGFVGYQTIAYEILENLKKIPKAVYMPVSSGTIFLGVAKGFEQVLSSTGNLNQLPLFIAVQTTAVHTLANDFDKNFISENRSLASGIVAKSLPRKKEIRNYMDGGWVVSNSQIKYAHEWLSQHQIKTSYEGAVALAGYFKAQTSHKPTLEDVIILLTGSL